MRKKNHKISSEDVKITEDTMPVNDEDLELKMPKEKMPPRPMKVKKSHFWRNFMGLVLLILLCGSGFLYLQLQKTKQINAETLQKLQMMYEEKIIAVTKRINVLDNEIAALKAKPVAAGVGENQLNQRIAALKEELSAEIAALFNKEKEVADTAANMQTKTAETAEINAAEKHIQEVLLASGALIVRDLAEQNVNFAYEAEVLQILAQGNDLATEYARKIRDYANSGVVGKEQLIRNFNKIFAELNTAQAKKEAPKAEVNHKWYEKLWFWLKNAVAVKKSAGKPVFSAENDEVLALVRGGRLPEALNELKISEKYAKIDSKPLREWQEQAERYLNFNSAINGLIMNALANIKLKEMEHAAQ